jgi:hypothetical protein
MTQVMTASMKTEIDNRTVSQALRQLGHYPDAAMWPTEYVHHVPTQDCARKVLAALGYEEPTTKDRQKVREVMRAIKLGVDTEAEQLVPSLTEALLEAFDTWMRPQIPNGGPSVHPTRLLRDACRQLQSRWLDRARRCPDCGEILEMNYHDADGNCIHQPL